MSLDTINGSAYPRQVEDLLPEARKLAELVGEVPSRNRLMSELRIGAPKAMELRAVLAQETHPDTRTEPVVEPEPVAPPAAPVAEPSPLVEPVGHPEPGRSTGRAETAVLVAILLVVGLAAGAASFTHVHDWTMNNSPAETPDWFGWANACISELVPVAALLEIRRRRRGCVPIGYPVAILIAAAALSLAAQLAVAKPGFSGGLLSAVPALAFIALVKLVLAPPMKGDRS